MNYSPLLVEEIPNLLKSIYTWLTSHNKNEKFSFAYWEKLLKIIKVLMEHSEKIGEEWETYLWE